MVAPGAGTACLSPLGSAGGAGRCGRSRGTADVSLDPLIDVCARLTGEPAGEPGAALAHS